MVINNPGMVLKDVFCLESALKCNLKALIFGACPRPLALVYFTC